MRMEGGEIIKIDSYTFGRIVINGKTYTSDIIIYPNWIAGYQGEGGTDIKDGCDTQRFAGCWNRDRGASYHVLRNAKLKPPDLTILFFFEEALTSFLQTYSHAAINSSKISRAMMSGSGLH